MNITPLFESQQFLDNKVTERVKSTGYETNSYYAFDHKVFAFHCELMELANEIGFFKFWKQGHKRDLARILDEGVDCVHFLLSIGNMKGYYKSTKEVEPFALWEDWSTEDMFTVLRQNQLDNVAQWTRAFELVLGILLKQEMSESDIFKGYYRKNEVNLNRQAEGY